MSPTPEKEPTANWWENKARPPEAQTPDPPAAADHEGFGWTNAPRIRNAAETRSYLDALRASAATPEQRRRGMALLKETASRLRKRQTAATTADQAPDTAPAREVAAAATEAALGESPRTSARRSRRRPHSAGRMVAPETAGHGGRKPVPAYA